SFTCEAKVVGKRLALKCVIGPTPLRPSSCDLYRSATLWASGVTAPIPVITTRLLMAVFSLDLSTHHPGTLAEIGEADFQEIGLLQRTLAPVMDGHRALGVWFVVVQGRRQRAVLQGQQAGRQFRGAAAGAQVADVALQGEHRYRRCALAEHLLQAACLADVGACRAVAIGIDM